MDYTKLSNVEINERLAELLGYVVWDLTLPSGDTVTVMRKTHNSDTCKMPLKDYCNSWADMGRVAVENLIAIVCPTGEDMLWHCHDFAGEIEYAHENPLRAAAVVAIQVLEAKQ